MYLFFELPVASNGIEQYNLGSMSDERITALRLPREVYEKYSYTIDLPQGWRLLTTQMDQDMDNGAGSMEIEINQKRDRVVINKKITIHQEIGVEDYPAFLKLIRTWQEEKYNVLVLVPVE